MTFKDTAISGVWIVEADLFPDERGVFARTWAPEEFAARGLETTIAQVSMASNHERGTIRGLHYQRAPVGRGQARAREPGRDLRRRRRHAARLADLPPMDRRRALERQPPDVVSAEGLRARLPDARGRHRDRCTSSPRRISPPHQEGVRWNDPALAIAWPLGAPTRISPGDAAFPDFHVASG